jgi:hypothetical protein
MIGGEGQVGTDAYNFFFDERPSLALLVLPLSRQAQAHFE